MHAPIAKLVGAVEYLPVLASRAPGLFAGQSLEPSGQTRSWLARASCVRPWGLNCLAHPRERPGATAPVGRATASTFKHICLGPMASAGGASGPRVAWLLAINDDGMPLLSRCHGTAAPSLTARGLVAALFETSSMKGSPLGTVATDDGTIAFAAYDSGMLLALLSSWRGAWAVGGSDGEAARYQATLDAIHDSMVLLLGRGELRKAASNRPAERKALQDGLKVRGAFGAFVCLRGALCCHTAAFIRHPMG